MRLGDIAKVVRSKNAGPFIMTFDILFDSVETLEKVRAGGHLTVNSVAAAYNVSPNEVMDFDYYPFARAVKFCIRRPVSSGAAADTDVYGAQQHAPLLELDLG